jgi:hypothetical protein
MSYEEQFAAKIRLALNQSASRLDDNTVRRLEQARAAALARHKPGTLMAAAPSPVLAGAAARGHAPQPAGPANWWLRAGWLIPAMAVIMGIFLLHQNQEAQSNAELAKIDAEVLADDLPISAYLDKGFHRYLQQGE